jgi:hypothetical protein
MYKRLCPFLFAIALCVALPFAVRAQDAGSAPPVDQGQPMQPISGGDQNAPSPPPPGDQQNPPPPSDQGAPPPGQPQNQPQNPPPQNNQPPYQGLQPVQDGPNPPPFNPGQNNPNPTCNVNGVEKPGPCPGQGQQMNGGQGMTDEQQQKMEEEQQKRDEQMQAQQFKQMKSEVKRIAKNIKTIQTRIDKLVKQKIAIPDEIKSQIAEAKAAADEITAATDPEAVQDQMDSLRDIGNSLPDIARQLDSLARLPSMLKQADSQMKRQESAYKSAVTRTTRAKFDASSVLTKWRATLDEFKAVIAKLKAGDYGEDDPMQTLRDEFFDRSDEANQYQQTVDMVLNAKTQMKRIATALKKYQTTIARLEKKKEDMTEAKELLAEMQAKYDEVSKVVSGGIDPDEVEAVLGDMDVYADMQGQIEDLLHLAPMNAVDQQMKSPPPGGSLKMSMTSAQKSIASVLTLRTELAKLKRPAPKTMLAQFGLLDMGGLTQIIDGAKSQAFALANGSNLSGSVKGSILATIESLGY